MRKRFAAGATALVIVALISVAAFRVYAITYGQIDSTNAYPNVGAFIVQAPTGEIYPICSGTLITPDVFLTASHCTAFFTNALAGEGYTAFVSFDPSIGFGDLSDTEATTLLAVREVVTNPGYNQAQSDSGDIGVLILEESVTGIAPATLAECGLLDQLAQENGLKGAGFTAVGYGLQERVVGAGVPYFQDVNPIPRMYSLSSFNALNPGYLRLSQNPATGDGGTCFGDSGGPAFLRVDGEQILVAITITGDAVCRASNVVYRLDTPSAQAFLEYVNTTYGTSIPTTCTQ